MEESKTLGATLKRHKEILVLCLVLAVVLVVMSQLSRHFLSFRNLLEATRLGAEIGIIAIGMAMVILLGGIDLSVGAMFAMGAVTMGIVIDAGMGIAAAMAAALVVGLILGAVNGVIVSTINIPPIITTLGTMSLYRGIAMGVSRGRSYPIPEALYDAVGGNSLAGIPVQFIVFLIAAAIVVFLLYGTTLGRSLIATGNNAVAAMFSGVNVRRVKIFAYSLSGFFCALAGILFSCRVTSAKADFGQGYEMDAITIVVLGGASLKGGKANIPGVLLGMLILILTRRGLTMGLVQPELQTVIFGLLLIAAVGFNSLSTPVGRGK